MSASASFVKSLLAQCCLGGICEWVVCPGARNMALLQVLAAAEDLVKWTHFDERSAAFFALGRIQDMGLPVAVVTTSGTAAAELLPAVVEAYYQRRPLLLLTADRPADYRGSAAPQAIEQADLFGIYAPTIDLETPDSLPEDILEDWDYASPLHINVCLPDPDPAWNPGNCDLYPAEPPEENDFRGSLAELARALRFKSRDGLVVMLGGLDPTEQAPARWLANELKAPVVADATSGLREDSPGQRIRRAALEQVRGVELVQDAGGSVRQDAADEVARLGAAFQQVAQHAAESRRGGLILGKLPGLLLFNIRVAGGNLGIQGRQGIGDHVVVHVFGEQGDGLVHGDA